MIWEVHPDGAQWSLRRTPAGRALEALRWGAWGGAATFAFGAIYFGIDWVGRTALGADVPPMFWLSVAAFAFFGGFLGFVVRMLRFRHWVIDRKGRTLSLSVRRVFADPQVDEVSFDEIDAILLWPTRVSARFADGEEIELAKAIGKFGFDGVERGLRRAFDETGLDVISME